MRRRVPLCSIKFPMAAILMALSFIASPCSAQAMTDPPERNSERRRLDIAPQPLASALAALRAQRGIELDYEPAWLEGLRAPALKGDYSDTRALQLLLAGSGLQAQPMTAGHYKLAPAPAAVPGDVVSGALAVESTDDQPATGEARDRQGYDDVYNLDASSVYKGKQELERYRGENPADLLKGMVNVFSGDARNSGALDPNIRGIEGPGRVPVLIDGTEQALTVWRGYNGANNRAYIDPALIGGVQVLKGPTTERDIAGGVGGAVVVKTLDVDDVLKPGRHWGADIKLEGANNSVSPHWPHLLGGQDYRDIPGFPGAPGSPPFTIPNAPYSDPSLLHPPGNRNHLVSMGDRAYRIALAGRKGPFDALLAYAYRQRGNYYAGEGASGYYTQDIQRGGMNYIIRKLGMSYRPGNEVPNTSSRMQSWLGKLSWHPTPNQQLQLGLRDSLSRYGEVMPSRIFISGVDDIGAIQWPESKVDSKAYNLEYRWKPDNPWLDLYANLWTTRTGSHTYTSGGFPNYAQGPDNPIIYNTALANQQNNRVGLSLSNHFQLGDRLDLTLGGDWQHEKLSTSDIWNSDLDGWRMYPRAGRRQEYHIRMKLAWRPVDGLDLQGGLNYSGYWAHDDFLASQIRAGNGHLFKSYYSPSQSAIYNTLETTPDKALAQIRQQALANGRSEEEAESRVDFWRNQSWWMEEHSRPYRFQNEVYWYPDANGKYHRKDDICINGFLNTVPNLIPGKCSYGESNQGYTVLPDARPHRAHGLAPWFSASYQFTPSIRAYARYAEAYRFPSMFESTVGFSGALNPMYPIKPEHAYNMEVGYVQDLRDWLGLSQQQRADIKLAWFSQRTHNVIERGDYLQFSNIDKQVIKGLELQARFDNSRLFFDFGAAYTPTNKACDESTAILKDSGQGRIPDCVNYGFVSSYLLTQASPKFSANLNLGARFLHRSLEIGSRSVYYRAYHNRQLDEWVGARTIGGYGLNVPYTWGTIATIDAYADYHTRRGTTFELADTNLSNRYYVDPLTRSLMPAPGRTLRFSINARF
ncbi:outer membrane receptor protein [Frateuria aurantia DSM 6220]|uniref:Outer membrane receptor protein n=2 Tax=Frateuria aurantia TaxID=81475 RepID=H8L0E9_FRAAD|nr:outer membrane receptor protein [Frateuria aurantia DSM 6220]